MSQVPPPPQPPYPQQPYGQTPTPGYAGPGAVAAQQQRRTSGAAVASLIFGILGCIPFITGLLAVICGILGIAKTKDPRYSGRGLAIAGLLLGLLSIVLWGVFGSGAYALYAYGKPARNTANQFARDLSAGDVQAAQSRCTPTVTREEIETAIKTMKPWGALKETTLPIFLMNKSTGSAETAEVGPVAIFQNAPNVAYFAHLVKENGQFKVDGFFFQNNQTTVVGGTSPQNAPRARGRTPAPGGGATTEPEP
jgi:hypothetical protein